MQRQVTSLDAGEFGLDALLRRVQDDAAALAEDDLLDLDEAEQPAMADLTGLNLVDLALIGEDDPEYVT